MGATVGIVLAAIVIDVVIIAIILVYWRRYGTALSSGAYVLLHVVIHTHTHTIMLPCLSENHCLAKETGL